MKKRFIHVMVLAAGLAGAALPQSARGQAQKTYTLYAFPAPNGSIPSLSAVTRGSDGAFYGTTCDVTPVTVGGMTTYSYSGTIYRMTATGVITTLYTIPGISNSQNNLGWGPFSALIQAPDGNFYGTTFVNGANLAGTVYKMTPTGGVTTLHNFTGGNDGAKPYGALIQASDGNLYGSTRIGGASGKGTLFRITPQGTLTTIHTFSGSDGAMPYAALVQGADGNLYGSTLQGGTGKGVLFRMALDGSGYTKLHEFSGGADGSTPSGALLQFDDGTLYGTTYDGAGGVGTVFRMAANGSGFSTLHAFANGADGGNPEAGLTLGQDGYLYGTTAGTNTSAGTVYLLATDGSNYAVLYNFGGGGDGGAPNATLIQSADGNFFGTANSGGSNSGGVLFEIGPQCRLTLLHSFTAAEGKYPKGLLPVPGGSFFAAMEWGGANDAGSLVSITPAGAVTNLHSFNFTDGNHPEDTLVLGADGNLYGTASGGGNGSTQGTTFKMTPSGGFTSLDTFYGSNGANPYAGLTLGLDGNFYGTTINGGNGAGLAFQMTPTGTLKTIATFIGSDTSQPFRRLLLFSDGNFYGTGDHGGANGAGNVFRMTPAGTVTSLYSFTQYGATGASPIASLVAGFDGQLYGCATSGGGRDSGTLFKITTAGVLTELASLNDYTGGNPTARLLLANDGNLYGLAPNYGSMVLGGVGTIFKVTPSGAFSIIYVFTGADGAPSFDAGLVQGADGFLYGVATGGGANGYGTFFKLDVGTSTRLRLLFENLSTGQLAQWSLNGVAAAAGSYVSPKQDPAWVACAQADLTGNDQPDIVFQNRNTGQLAVWIMNGTTALHGMVLTPTPAAGWRCVGAADFNGDGHPDLLFQNASTGQLAVWFLSGTTVTGGAFITPNTDPAWRAVGAADFNGDGQTDILFQNQNTGRLAVWYLNGTNATSGAYLASKQDPAWQAVALEDLDRDGEDDILFQNQNTGQLAVWYLSGVTVTGATFLSPTPPAGWTVVGPK